MTPEMKQRLIKRFIEEMSTQPYVMADGEVESIPSYAALGEALDALERNHNDLLDFANVETDLPKWEQLKGILNKGLVLRAGAPAQITAIAPDRMNREARSISDDLFLANYHSLIIIKASLSLILLLTLHPLQA